MWFFQSALSLPTMFPPMMSSRTCFRTKNKDFVFTISETDIVLVKEIKGAVDEKDLEKLARSIADTLSSEFYTRVNVGIGTIVNNVKELSRSFKEAQMALEVGKVFDTDKAIVSYDNLGIARLIYHLPTTLCETFLHEVFKRGSTIRWITKPSLPSRSSSRTI